MNKTLSKIKIGLTTLWIAIMSFFSKVIGQEPIWYPLYWVPEPEYRVPWYSLPVKPTLIDILVKISNWIILWITIPVILIVGIVNIKKIRKISDKAKRKKKIIRTIITLLLISIWAVVLYILLRLLIRFLLKNDSTY